MMRYDEDLMDAGLAEMAAEVAAEAVGTARFEQRRFQRARRRRTVLGLTALGLAGSVGVAAAVQGARTGQFGLPGFTENDTSEYLDTSAPDYPDVLRAALPDLPLPPNVTMEELVQQQVASVRAMDRPVIVQETGVRATAVSFALCHWESTWLRADAATGEPVRADAVRHLRALARRPELAAVDGGGVVARQRELAEAAATGDRAALQNEIELNCAGWVQ